MFQSKQDTKVKVLANYYLGFKNRTFDFDQTIEIRKEGMEGWEGMGRDRKEWEGMGKDGKGWEGWYPGDL